MKIHPIVYIIVGLAVVFFTRYVESRSEDAGMTFFLYVGFLFLAIGLFKLIILFLFKEKKANVIKQENNHKAVAKKKIISCQTCGVKHYSNSNYCHMCGTKLRK